MSRFHRALTITAALTAAAHLAGCITVEPSSNSGKTALKTATLIKKITPSKKTTMVIPASHRSYATETERKLACEQSGSNQKRIIIFDDGSNGRVVSDVAINCASYSPAHVTPAVKTSSYSYEPSPAYTQAPVIVEPTPIPASDPMAARTIRVAVDGSTQVFEIDASGVARPQSRSITHTQIYQPTPQNHTQVYQAPSYQEPTRTYRVRRGDTLYSIARRKCVALEDLTGANNIRRPYTIVPDQQLTLPRGAC